MVGCIIWLNIVEIQLSNMLFGMTITIANVVLPQIRGAMSASQDEVSWAITLNLVAAAVATPLYLSNTRRARASEAVATMGLIRQAERDYKINNNAFFDVDSDEVQEPLPPSTLIDPTNGDIGPLNQFKLPKVPPVPKSFFSRVKNFLFIIENGFLI